VVGKVWSGMGVVSVALAIASVGCSSGEKHRPFSDQSGGRFDWVCDDGDCDVVVTEASCGDQAAVVGGKWLSVCTGDSAFYAENCRLIACSADSDCDFYSGYSCRSGYCEDASFSGPGVALTEDVFAVCLADASRSDVCRTASQPAHSALVDVVRGVCPRGELGCERIPEECTAP
jgi:hypothetical protein